MVALKVVPVDRADEETQETIAREIAILKRCDSPYIVSYFASYLKLSESQLWVRFTSIY